MSFSTGISHGECETGVCPCKFVSTSMTVWTAAEHGNIDIIMAKYSKSPKSINKLDNYGYTPLHYAAQQNHHHIVKFLLAHKAQPDLQCCGATPLHRAAFAGSYESCSLLIEAGSDVNAQDYSFGDLNTPIQKAILQKHQHLLDLFLHHKDVDLALENAAGLSPSVMLKQLADESTHIHSKTIPEDAPNMSTIIGTIYAESDTNVASQLQMSNMSLAGGVHEPPVNETRCSVCKQTALSYARTKFNDLICLSCKYRSSQRLNVEVSSEVGDNNRANDDLWRSM